MPTEDFCILLRRGYAMYVSIFASQTSNDSTYSVAGLHAPVPGAAVFVR
jgi:hypothetical protein